MMEKILAKGEGREGGLEISRSKRIEGRRALRFWIVEEEGGRWGELTGWKINWVTVWFVLAVGWLGKFFFGCVCDVLELISWLRVGFNNLECD